MSRLSFTALRGDFLELGLILTKEPNNKFEVKQDNGKTGRARRINTIATLKGLPAVAEWLIDYTSKNSVEPESIEDVNSVEQKPTEQELTPVEYIYTFAPVECDITESLISMQVLPLVNGDGKRWREIKTTDFNAQFDAYIFDGYDAFNRESWEGVPDQLGLKFLQIRRSIATDESRLSFLEKQPLEYYKPSSTNLSPTSEAWAVIKLLTDNPNGLTFAELNKYVPSEWDILTLTRRLSQAGYGADISSTDDGTQILKLIPAFGTNNAD